MAVHINPRSIEMNTNRRRCIYCRQLFLPSPYHPKQRICTSPRCRRRHQTAYHREKQQTDPDYRQTCLLSQQKWRQRHPDYQRRYREKNPAYVQQNRQAQKRRDRKRRLGDLVKNNMALDLNQHSAEVWLLGRDLQDLVKNNIAISQVMICQTVTGANLHPP